MKGIGMKFRKVGSIPANGNIEAKKNQHLDFLRDELTPKLDEAKAGLRKVYFVDAAHFVWGAFLGYLWCFLRSFLPTSSGRIRYNVLGAIDAVSHNLITFCNNGYINSTTVCELLSQIRNLDREIAVTIVVDNAKYQRCNLVANHAD